MRKNEFKVLSIWWSDEEVFYVEFIQDNAIFITTLELEEFEQSRVELNINNIKFNYMTEYDTKKIASHALNKYYSANKFFDTDLPLIEETMPLLIKIYYSIKFSPQCFWEYSPNDKDKITKIYKFNLVANMLKEAAVKYKFEDVLDINKKENNISVYGDFICRFKTHRIVNSEKEVEILINEKRKNEIFLMV